MVGEKLNTNYIIFTKSPYWDEIFSRFGAHSDYFRCNDCEYCEFVFKEVESWWVMGIIVLLPKITEARLI